MKYLLESLFSKTVFVGLDLVRVFLLFKSHTLHIFTFMLRVHAKKGEGSKHETIAGNNMLQKCGGSSELQTRGRGVSFPGRTLGNFMYCTHKNLNQKSLIDRLPIYP